LQPDGSSQQTSEGADGDVPDPAEDVAHDPSGAQKALPWIAGILIGLVIGGLVVWLLTSDGDEEVTTSSSTTSEDATSTSEPGSDTSQPPSSTEPGSTVPGAATTTVSVPAPSMDPTAITRVDVANHDGFNRVVFEFDAGIPGYEVGYTPRPITEDGSGLEVDVQGAEVITVRMTPASVVRFTDDGYDEVYAGPDRIAGPATPVSEVVQVGDFEAQATWAIGVKASSNFAVSTLTSPDRLVIDVVDP